MARIAHNTSYTVSCAAAGGATCPTPGQGGMPNGSQNVGAGDREYFNTFWAVVNLPVGAKLTFTITATTTVQTGVCADSTEAMVGGWARFGRNGFIAPDDVEASASSVGTIDPVTQCADGRIAMTNKVTNPGPESDPARVLSTDPRVFVATWKNTTGQSQTVPIKYTYYVPYTGQDTEASWTCTASSGSCPTWATTGSRHIDHDSPGEDDDVVFGDATTDPSATADGVPVTLAAGQTLTFTITLATTLNTCTQDGYLRVQSYAVRGAATGETGAFRKQASSKLVEIGCSTWLMMEKFDGASVADSAWKGIGSACLTRTASGTAASNGLGYCSARSQVPPTGFDPGSTGLPAGYLKLTDASASRSGAALYDRALPSKNGLVLEFTQYQYGGNGADGIGFFLTDGNYSLTATGADGGALGYGAKGGNQNGLANAYIGVGFDAFGNFSVDGDGGGRNAACTTKSSSFVPGAVVLRGPGAKDGSGLWRNDYCYLAGKKLSDINPSYSLRHQTGSLSTNADFQAALTGATRKTRVTVYPLKENETAPKVTVEVDFGSGYVKVIDKTVTAAAPALIKFGFLGSTGGSTDAHLISSMRVGTVLPMEALNLVKVVDAESPNYRADGNYSIDKTVPYKFQVTNTSSSPVYQFSLTDPLLTGITCPNNPTQLAPGQGITCTGSLVVNDAQRTDGRIINTATAQGATSATGSKNLTARSSATVVTNPSATDATRVIGPAGTATFQVIKQGATLGLVAPDDPSRLTLSVWKESASAWVPAPTGGSTPITVSNGTWNIDANNKVSFVHDGSTNYAVTPLKYRVTNAFGGFAEANLNVSVTIAPAPVCTPAQHNLSARNWGFGKLSTFTFGAAGTSTPTAATLANLASNHGTFTVSDSKGNLLFVVDSGTGTTGSAVIRTRTGAAMAGSSMIGDQLFGASPVAVFPAGQGTGKFVVVTSSATTSAAGQLSYRTVDMSQNGGLGSVSAAANLGGTNASTAVTAVPNADQSGYWVVNPKRNSADVLAYPFVLDTPTNPSSPVVSTVGSTVSSTGTPTRYEDIRFNSDMTRVATLASSSGASGADRTVVRLLTLNAANGKLSAAGTTFEQKIGAASEIGYSLDFTPNTARVFVSSVPASSGSYHALRYLSISSSNNSSSLGSLTNVSTSQVSGGAVRAAGNGVLYWAKTGSTSTVVSISSSEGTPSVGTQSIASGSTSTLGLTNVLADCAIPAAEFALEKYASDGTTPMSGASFAVYPDNNGTPSSTPATPGVQAVSGEVGKFTVKGLAPGAYWLRETTALPGHQLLAQDVLINVSLGGGVALDTLQNPQVKLVTSGSGANTTYTIKITNTKAPALPLAGGQPLQWLTIGGISILALALLGTAWWRRRRGYALADLPTDDSLHHN